MSNPHHHAKKVPAPELQKQDRVEEAMEELAREQDTIDNADMMAGTE